jgi:PAS domain S-box-containing protein
MDMKRKPSLTTGGAWLEGLTARKAAIRLAVGYAGISVLWILLSSHLVKAIAPNQEVQTLLEELKGWFYAAASALGLYYFTRRTLQRVQQLDQAMLQHVLEHRTEIDHYHMLLNASSDHIILFDPQKRYLTITDRTAALRNVSAAHLLGKTPTEALGAEAAERVERALDEVLRTRQPYHVMNETTVDGQRRWFSTIYDPVVGQSGDLKGVLVVSRDETEKIATGARAQQAAERHSRQLSVLNQVLQTASQPTNLNEVLRALLGKIHEVFKADAVGLHILDVDAQKLLLLAHYGHELGDEERYRELPLDDSLAGKAVREARLVTYVAGESPEENRPRKVSVDLESVAVTPVWARDDILGTLELIFLTRRRLGEDDVAVLEALGRGIGITIENARVYAQVQSDAEMLKAKVAERTEELENALIRAQSADRMKSGLLSTVSHEMRTPLSSIIGFSNLILSRKPDQPKLIDYVSAINAEARRLADLINDFLDLQRIESGREVFHPAHVDLSELTRDTINKLQVGEGFTIRLDLTSVPWLYIDPNRTRQVLLNLLSNAFKYSPNGGEILVSLRQEGDEVIFSIRDQGLGIVPDELSQLFERFHRGDVAERFRIRGTGLGLALCRQIVEAHGGRIWAESPGLDQGSTFSFALPVPQISGSNHREPTQSRPVIKLIAVIEESPDFSTYLAERLKPEGYFVQALPFSTATTEQIVQLAPALIVMDVSQDTQHPGWLLLSDLKRHPVVQDIPVLICSTSVDPEKAWELGAASYVSKPVKEKQLIEEIVRLIGKPPRRVLVVDDEAITRLMLNETLVAAGYQTDTAPDGEMAIETLKEGWPDLLILDLLMPKVNGFGVLEWIRQRNHELPVIVLTAAELTPMEQQIVRVGASALAIKSNTSPQQLLDLVRHIVAAEE